jgi:hypothetical protein
MVLIFGALVSRASAEQDNRFVYAQLRYDGDWDPYPDIYHEIVSFMATTTSIDPQADRVIVDIGSAAMFEYPVLIVQGAGEFPRLSAEIRAVVRNYCAAGGFIFIDDASGIAGSSFDRSIRRECKQLLPDNPLRMLSREHAVMRSFYLITAICGRAQIHNYLEGIDVQDRTCIMYSANDMLGTWARDRLGNYVYAFETDGDVTRKEAMKLTGNMLMYGLTGTYKTDAIHIPFILNKLRSHPY